MAKNKGQRSTPRAYERKRMYYLFFLLIKIDLPW